LNKEGVKPYFKIMVNGQDISLVQDLLTPIKTGDIVAIFPPIAGGQA
jgi:molybdopterin converting factor small subunit